MGVERRQECGSQPTITYRLAFSIDTIAAVCYAANRAYCQNALSDESMPAWEEAPEDSRNGYRNGVRSVLLGITQEQQHDSWCQDRKKRGWVYGPVKDYSKRTHPNLRPYQELPEAEKLKDLLFKSVVMTFVTPDRRKQLLEVD
jgi:hypothetical protein